MSKINKTGKVIKIAGTKMNRISWIVADVAIAGAIIGWGVKKLGGAVMSIGDKKEVE